jgi:hypothetical protein
VSERVSTGIIELDKLIEVVSLDTACSLGGYNSESAKNLNRLLLEEKASF